MTTPRRRVARGALANSVLSPAREYEGTIFLCADCGQPCHNDASGMAVHFSEQWDGIHCPMFPLAGQLISMKWDAFSLQELKQKYPDTYPHQTSAAA